MNIHTCLCCGYKTLESRGEYDICPVCFWEDDRYIDFNKEDFPSLYDDSDPTLEELLDEESGANHGLTLRQGRENYLMFGACEKSMLPHVRSPKDDER